MCLCNHSIANAPFSLFLFCLLHLFLPLVCVCVTYLCHLLFCAAINCASLLYPITAPMQSLYFCHPLLQHFLFCQCCEQSFTIHNLAPCDSLIKVPFLLPVLLCSQHVLGAAHTTNELLSITSQPLLSAVLSFSNFTLHYFFSFKA